MQSRDEKKRLKEEKKTAAAALKEEKKTRKILALLLSNNGTSIYFDKKSTTASEKIIVPSKYKSPQWEKTLNKVIDSLSQNESDAIDFTLAKLEDTIKCVVHEEREKNKQKRQISETEYSDFVKNTRGKFQTKQEEQRLIMDTRKKAPGILELILIHYSPVIRIDQHSLDTILDAEAHILTHNRIEEEIKKELDEKIPPFHLDCRIYEQI